MSWDQLGEIYREAAAAQAAAASAPLTECPTEGYPLEHTDRGAHCPFCGWIDRLADNPTPT